jgi:copine 5/8/9
MAGPTYFAPVFREAMEVIRKENKKDNYYILLILTDGEIHDMPATIDCLVDISQQNIPLSVIIVGIGNEDFANMVRLDGDDVAVAAGAVDVLQFVKFNEVLKRSEPAKLKENLAAIVLEEVPQ